MDAFPERKAGYKGKRKVALSTPGTGDEEWQALRTTLNSGWLTQGPRVLEFEAKFASRHGVEFAVATTSGTTALHLAMLALEVGPGDEVIVPAFTWVATANAVAYTGAVPIFVDVEPDTFNIDIEQIAKSLSSRTKVVVAVHLFGLCADIDRLRAVVPESVHIVEDAACAAGAAYKDRPTGGLGVIGCFSFHPRKSITTGEGGMVTTNNARLAESMLSLRNHGAVVKNSLAASRKMPYEMPLIDRLGFNYRMSDIQAAIGLVQLEKLDRYINQRNDYANAYSEMLADISWIRTPAVPAEYRHAWQAYVTVVDEARSPASRNEIMEHMASAGIETRPGTHAVTELDYYRLRYGTKCAVAAELEQTSIAVPLHNKMDIADVEYVSDALRRIG